MQRRIENAWYIDAVDSAGLTEATLGRLGGKKHVVCDRVCWGDFVVWSVLTGAEEFHIFETRCHRRVLWLIRSSNSSVARRGSAIGKNIWLGSDNSMDHSHPRLDGERRRGSVSQVCKMPGGNDMSSPRIMKEGGMVDTCIVPNVSYPRSSSGLIFFPV
ncbi:hypothetical protein GE21DRAFT_1009251 [Neurospora crassa]|nr:hypothetical protein GE21DRAFT_1009251 [Neurospora crassa]